MFKFLRKKRKPTAYEQLRGSILANEPLEDVALDPAESDNEQSPWFHFAAANRLAAAGANAAIEHLRYVVEMTEIETRTQLQAWHCLRALGVEPEESIGKEVHGIVVEVGLEAGVDSVAAYRDRTARYFNHSSAAVIWDTETAEMNASIDPLLEIAAAIGDSTAPFDEPHPPPPDGGVLLINILTPAGIHIGTGPMDIMQNDPMGAAVTQAAMGLMQKLMKVEEGG